MSTWQKTLDTVQQLARSKEIEQFRIDAADFLSARERGEAAGTRIDYWLVLLGYAAFNLWRNSFVKVPDGCQALITRFGKLEEIAGPGRKTLLNPWKRVSYIVNTTREYPYNAPIREAPTAERVNASVDLFLQFKIEDPAQFIFALGGSKGFSEKLQNAISEVTRALIYEQKAEDIYDLIGESTQSLLQNLNQQFLPAVRFVNANITHAEPSSQEYRMDLAAPELKVAETLMRHAPRPVVVRSGGGEQSALSTLVLAQMLPKRITPSPSPPGNGHADGHDLTPGETTPAGH